MKEMNVSAASRVCLELIPQVQWKVEEAKERLAGEILLAGEALKSQVELLISIKGITPLIALAFLADVADIRRFRTLRDMNAYLGQQKNLGDRFGLRVKVSRRIREALNNHLGTFRVTYFGFDPDVTRELVRERLLAYEKGYNRITELSRAYRIELGTGWYTPPGVVHAPGSVLTYEPQWNSDVNSVQENITSGEVYPREFLVENVPENRKQDIDYVMSLMDWEKNVDPHYRARFFRPLIPCPRTEDGLSAKWVVYANPYIGAKETTILPGRSVRVKEAAAFGCIIVQGFGKFGSFDAEAAGMLRFGQLSGDEYFVSEKAARDGVKVANASRWEPMVILQHFGPNNNEMPTEVPV